MTAPLSNGGDRQGMDKDSRWCIGRDLLVFTNPPSAVAKAHGMGLKGYRKSLDRLKSCCCGDEQKSAKKISRLLSQ